VLERLANLAGSPIQRIGASATVGNPDELLAWLQGSQAGKRPGRVIAPGVEPRGATAPQGPPGGDVELDFVGSVHNAAKVIAALHQGEKRLVFCDSRRLVEHLAADLRELGTTTFLSHASLSMDERRQAELAFAEGRDCVIVATSTLELGIDVGDLDRVIQINAPRTVASFLQRIGRTGRRAGTERNCLFLALDEGGLLDAAGLLRQWGDHWVEPVTAPPDPFHIVAQQILARCLQGRIGDRLWPEAWNGLAPFDTTAKPIVDYLVAEGFLDTDGGMLFIGPNAEKKFGAKHFADLTAVFCAPPEFTVMHGREEIGKIDPAVLDAEPDSGPKILLLGGRSWKPVHIDWKRRRCHVEASGEQGSVRWNSIGIPTGRSSQLVQGIRRVLLGEDPPVRLTRRAISALAEARERYAERVTPDKLIIRRDGADVRWWTWAGYRANLTLQSSLGRTSAANGVTDFYVRLCSEFQVSELSQALANLEVRLPKPDPRAVNGLKFNAALPNDIATRTLAARIADLEGAQAVLDAPRIFVL
jgi:ATP-dependent Lhr-like helicase